MSRKKWATLSDTALRKSASAWNYLRHYIVSGLSAQGVRLSYGRFAKMAPDMHVLRNTDSDCAWAPKRGQPCFGH